MTQGKKFKKKIRERMEVTGETYMQAKAAVEAGVSFNPEAYKALKELKERLKDD